MKYFLQKKKNTSSRDIIDIKESDANIDSEDYLVRARLCSRISERPLTNNRQHSEFK